MHIIFHETHSDIQIISPDQAFFFRSTAVPGLPDCGIWMMLTNTEQPIIWQDITDDWFLGDVRQQWPVATAAGVVVEIVRARSFHRFQFGGSFGRIN